MKYIALLLFSVLFIPVIQVAHAQNILEEIGEAFNNLTSGTMGGNETNETNQTSSNSSSASSGNETSSTSSGNETSTGIGSFQELQNLTSGNQEILTNGTDIGSNTSLGQGMEMEQYVEPENQSNALSALNNTQ